MKISRLPVVHHAICVIQRRNYKWPRIRKDHLKQFPVCAICGGKKGVEVHHIVPFHKNKKLELDPKNLITLCNRLKCHFIFGHLCNWKSWNKHVILLAKIISKMIRNRPK